MLKESRRNQWLTTNYGLSRMCEVYVCCRSVGTGKLVVDCLVTNKRWIRTHMTEISVQMNLRWKRKCLKRLERVLIPSVQGVPGTQFPCFYLFSDLSWITQNSVHIFNITDMIRRAESKLSFHGFRKIIFALYFLSLLLSSFLSHSNQTNSVPRGSSNSYITSHELRTLRVIH